MDRTLRHLFAGLAWLLAFTLVGVVLLMGPFAAAGPATLELVDEVGSGIGLIGFSLIFWSWARIDAPDHDRPEASAIVFAILSLFLFFLAHALYLFYTRGLQQGVPAVLKYACFLIGAGMLWLSMGKLVP